MASFVNPEAGQQVRITEGATNAHGNPLHGAAHQDSNTMFVDIEGNRLDSLVNTVGHEGLHLNGAGEANATVTGYLTDLAYRANAWANRDQIAEQRPSVPVPLRNPDARRQLLADNHAVFRDLEEREGLEYRQLRLAEASVLDQVRARIHGDSSLSELQKREANHRLNALACAEVRCAQGVSENDPHHGLLQQLQSDGETLKQQGYGLQAELSAHGVDGNAMDGGFAYGWRDQVDDALTKHENVVAGIQQTGDVVSGGVEAAGGVAVAIAGCATTGPGCVLAVGGDGWGEPWLRQRTGAGRGSSVPIGSERH